MQPLYFLHIHKTAGTSLNSFIQRHFSTDEILYEASVWPELWNADHGKFQRAKFLRGHLGINFVKLFRRAPRIITFLRHPVDRVLSHYNHYRTYRESMLAKIVQDEQLSIRDFVTDARTLRVVRNYQTRNIGLDLPVEFFWKHPSMEYLPSDTFNELLNDEIYDKAANNLQTFDFVGIVEHYQLSLCCLCRIFNWKPDFEIEHMRKTGRDKQPTVSSEVRAIIERETDLDNRLYESGKSNLVERLRKAFGFDIDVAALESMDRKAYRQLLDTAVEVCDTNYRRSFPPPTSHIRWSASDPIFGTGWHDVHGLGQIPHRWSGPAKESTIDLSIAKGCDYKLSMVILRFINEEVRFGLEIWIEDVKILHQLYQLPEDRWLLVGHIKNGAVAIDGPTSVHFRVPDTSSFVDMGYDEEDVMKRGFALQSFELAPICASDSTSL